MTTRELGTWTLQSAVVGLLVAGGSWGAFRLSSPPEEDIAVVRTPVKLADPKDSDDLAWSLGNEGIADAVRDSRPDPYVPAEPAPAALQRVVHAEPAAEAAPEPEAAPAAEAAWAAPLAAALKKEPPRAKPARSVLRMISLGAASSGFSVGPSAPYAAPAARAESAGPPGPAAVAEAAAAPEAPTARRPVPLRRAFVSAAPNPSAPPSGTALVNQQATDYGETESAPD